MAKAKRITAAAKTAAPGKRVNKRVAEPSTRPSNAVYSGSSSSGVTVTIDNALGIDTVWGCINVLSQDLAALPLSLKQKVGDKRKDASDHPAAYLLEEPNDDMTGFELRQFQWVRLLLWGNSFDQIVRDKKGTPIEIYPLDNKKIGFYRSEEGTLWYTYKTDKVEGNIAVLAQDEVLHLRGLSKDGIIGLSPIEQQRSALGLAKAAEDYGAEFYANGATASGILERATGEGIKPLSDEDLVRLKRSFDEANTGKGKRHKTILLEDGITWKQLTIPANQAQFLESRKYQRTVICGIFRVPSHMVNDLERATFGNIEEQGIMYVSHTLTPWCVNSEKRYAKSLLSKEERTKGGYYWRHNMKALLRGKFSEQMNGWATARQNGFVNANEVRTQMEESPYEGGDEYLVNSALGQAERPNSGGNQ